MDSKVSYYSICLRKFIPQFLDLGSEIGLLGFALSKPSILSYPQLEVKEENIVSG